MGAALSIPASYRAAPKTLSAANGAGARTLTSTAVNWTTKNGWYFDRAYDVVFVQLFGRSLSAYAPMAGRTRWVIGHRRGRVRLGCQRPRTACRRSSRRIDDDRHFAFLYGRDRFVPDHSTCAGHEKSLSARAQHIDRACSWLR